MKSFLKKFSEAENFYQINFLTSQFGRLDDLAHIIHIIGCAVEKNHIICTHDDDHTILRLVCSADLLFDREQIRCVVVEV